MAKRRRNNILARVMAGVLMVILVGAGVLVGFNFMTIRDYVVGLNYEPSVEMVNIRESLNLAEKGRFVFNAAQPELNERGDFNRNCRAFETDAAILGCYARGRIFLYDIKSEELSGIRELATAHELLHAVYLRMSDVDKAVIKGKLEEVLEENKEILETEIGFYDDDEAMEELFVRAGTEVRDLPEELEAVYAEIFNEQDKIVEFYNGYIAVFRKIEEQQAKISDELSEVKNKLDELKVTYERDVAQLSADVVSFNACAAVDGCIKSKTEFDTRRNVLIKRQGELEDVYAELNDIVEEYNKLVEEYNSLVVHGQMLNSIINSAELPQEIK